MSGTTRAGSEFQDRSPGRQELIQNGYPIDRSYERYFSISKHLSTRPAGRSGIPPGHTVGVSRGGHRTQVKSTEGGSAGPPRCGLRVINSQAVTGAAAAVRPAGGVARVLTRADRGQGGRPRDPGRHGGVVARRYYFDGQSKVEIGRRLKLSRFQVARLLDWPAPVASYASISHIRTPSSTSWRTSWRRRSGSITRWSSIRAAIQGYRPRASWARQARGYWTGTSHRTTCWASRGHEPSAAWDERCPTHPATRWYS